MSDGSEGLPPWSQEFLLGLPGLSQTNLAKVTSANLLYQRVEFLIGQLEKLGITWTVENPTNSFCGIYHFLHLPWPMENYIIAMLVLMIFLARCCLGQVPGGAPFSQRSEQATACTNRMQIRN